MAVDVHRQLLRLFDPVTSRRFDLARGSQEMGRDTEFGNLSVAWAWGLRGACFYGEPFYEMGARLSCMFPHLDSPGRVIQGCPVRSELGCGIELPLDPGMELNVQPE